MTVRIADSDMYHDDLDLADALWADGFRPANAHTVRPGDTIAYATTLFGATVGSVAYGVVHTVREDGYTTVRIGHDGGETDADSCAEVWVRRQP